MRKILATGLLMMVLHGAAGAQPGEPPAETRAAMARLSFMTGAWKGDAWMQTGPGPRFEMTQTEAVAARLDGLVLTIEGEGRLKNEPDQIVHLAFATITYDVDAKNYRVQAVRKDGKSVDAIGAFAEDGAFVWGFDMMGGSVRYNIRHTDADEWLEIGEFSMDGTEWRQFFEMRLNRVK